MRQQTCILTNTFNYHRIKAIRIQFSYGQIGVFVNDRMSTCGACAKTRAVSCAHATSGVDLNERSYHWISWQGLNDCLSRDTIHTRLSDCYLKVTLKRHQISFSYFDISFVFMKFVYLYRADPTSPIPS